MQTVVFNTSLLLMTGAIGYQNFSIGKVIRFLRISRNISNTPPQPPDHLPLPTTRAPRDSVPRDKVTLYLRPSLPRAPRDSVPVPIRASARTTRGLYTRAELEDFDWHSSSQELMWERFFYINLTYRV